MDSGMALLERMINAAGLRHRVLASNIANVDTPGYKARDINFQSVMEGEEAVLITTDQRHIQPQASAATQVTEGPADSPWADGNNVELDEQTAKMTENALLYQAALSLLSTKMKMYKSALVTR